MTHPPVVGIEYMLEVYHPKLKDCYLVFCPHMLLTRIEGKLTGLWSINRNYRGSVIKTVEGNLLLNIPVLRDLTVQFNGEEIEHPNSDVVEDNLKKDILREWKPDFYNVIVHELVHLLDIAVKEDKLDFSVPYMNRDVEVKAYFIDRLARFIKTGYSKYKSQPFTKFFEEFVHSKYYSDIYEELNSENKKKISKWLYQIYIKKVKNK